MLRFTYEGLTNFQSSVDFERDSIKSISKFCSKNIDAIVANVPDGIAAKNAVPGTNISTISICRLVVATNDVKYYTAIGWMPAFDNMQYVNVLGYLKTDYDDYVLLKKQTSHEVPLVGDKDKDKKIIKWVSIFEDVISRTFSRKI